MQDEERLRITLSQCRQEVERIVALVRRCGNFLRIQKTIKLKFQRANTRTRLRLLNLQDFQNFMYLQVAGYREAKYRSRKGRTGEAKQEINVNALGDSVVWRKEAEISDDEDTEYEGVANEPKDSKVASASKKLFDIIIERSKNRISLQQFKRYVRYFKKELFNSNLVNLHSEDAQKEYNLKEFRRAVFGDQPWFYAEALWIFEQVFQLQQGTDAYEDGDYYTNKINLNDTVLFLSWAFPELLTGIANIPIGGLRPTATMIPILSPDDEQLTLTSIAYSVSEGTSGRSTKIAARKPSLSLAAVIENDVNALKGDHEIFKDEFEQFKHVLGVETNASALGFFNLIRKHEKTITWKQVASLLKFLEDMKENIQAAIRDEENCPRAEDEDPTVGELKLLLKIYSDDHANWLFDSVSKRHDDKITWLEVRDYLEEWDVERATITGHFKDQAATRVKDKHIVSQINDIQSAVYRIQRH